MKNFRPAAYPLMTVDPFFSVWSCADNLYDDCTRSWTELPNPILAGIIVNGRFYSMVATDVNFGRNRKKIRQTNVNISPLSTEYIFENEFAKVKLTFTTPLLLDRIDIEVELPSISYNDLTDAAAPAETSREVRARVMRARAFAALHTQGEKGVFCNAQLDAAGIRKYCKTDEIGGAVLRKAYDRMGLSARGYDRIMRVARTIADLAQSELICAEHIAEAIQLRSLDRKYWGEG